MSKTMTTAQVLDRVDEELAKRELIMSMINKENYQAFGTSVVLQTFQICQYMMDFFAILKGFEVNQNGMVIDQETQRVRPMPVQQLFSQLDDYIPQKYSKLLMSMRMVRNKAAHMQSLTSDDYTDYLDAFNSFGLWFVTNKVVLEYASDDQKRSFSRHSVSFGERIISEPGVKSRILRYYYKTSKTTLDHDDIKEVVHDEIAVAEVISEGDRIADSKIDKVLQKLDRIEANQNLISSQLTDISKQIEKLSEKVTDYQTLVDRQLAAVDSVEAQEQILSAYTDVLIDKIKSGIITQYDQQEYRVEANMLKQSFGDTWNKLQPSTQKFLISSKLLYRHQIVLGDQTDYSGVCVLITKALEVEMSKRFFSDFMGYLKAHCVRATGPRSEKYLDFPTFMLNKWKKPIKAKDFTLGSVAYVLCYLVDDKLTEEEQDNNRQRLIEFCKSELLSGKNDTEIMDLLAEYAENIETVRKDYRNPSAHTNMLQEINAKECMDLVIDVEKLLKRMVDSFDK